MDLILNTLGKFLRHCKKGFKLRNLFLPKEMCSSSLIMLFKHVLIYLKDCSHYHSAEVDQGNGKTCITDGLE